jgi:threonine dehydratase
MPGEAKLSPTSQAMVASSNVIVAIGGGEVGRDEFLAARAAGKDVRFIPADMNHAQAVDKARKRGSAAPADHAGALAAALARPGTTLPPAK